MSIVSYRELLSFAGMPPHYPGRAKPIILGVRGPEDVNASSIDVRLGDKFLIECAPLVGEVVPKLFLAHRSPMRTFEYVAKGGASLVLTPGAFVLAHTAESFDLPLDISAEFRLKSSAARMGLSHALAVWCDPGWHGSSLTLELHNISRFQDVVLSPGDKIGQMIFHRHERVPEAASYAVRGAYNNDAAVSGAKPPRTFEDSAAEILNREFNTKEPP